MDEIICKKNTQTYFLILFLGILYAIFPTANSSMDAIVYAADAKWEKDLFQSHHLFYTLFIYLTHFLVPIDFLALGKLINALFSAASLFVLWKCISSSEKDEKTQFWLVAFAGSSFAVFRFATENETYIIPVFCSLLGTYYYFKFENEHKMQLFLAGFWLSLACLFHQLHFFWWLVLLFFLVINQKNKVQKVFIYTSSAILVPIAYYLVLVFYKNTDFTISNYFAFVFESFMHGKASIEIKALGIVRFFVSLFRTFFHFHHTLLLFLNKYPVFWIIPIFAFLVFTFLLYKKIINFKKLIFKKENYKSLILSLILAFLAFALVSFGNSEFMVMIPFLVALLLAQATNLNIKILSYLVGIEFVWNFILGVVPNHFINFRADKIWAKKIEMQPNAFFYMSNYGEISGLIYYNNPNIKQNVFFNNCDKIKMDSILNQKINVYTDCIKTGNVLNTENLLFGNTNQKFYQNYKTICVDSAESFSGKEYLYQVFLK